MIVTVNVPVSAFLFALNVNVVDPDPVTDVGLKLAEVPRPNPLTLNDTEPLNPFAPVTVTVVVPLLFRFTVSDAGDAPSVKLAACATTVTGTFVEWLNVPLVPVTVTVYVPPGVELVVATVNVELDPGFTELGLNEHVAPVGHPVAPSDTDPVNPFTAVTLMLDVPLCPWFTETLVGFALIVKSGAGAVTVTLTPVEWLNVPLVPVTLTVYVPPGVELVVATVNVELDPGFTELGLNEHVAPVGHPVALSATEPLNPFAAVTLIVDVPFWPCVIETLVGLALTEKSCTATVTLVEWLNVPLVPVTVAV